MKNEFMPVDYGEIRERGKFGELADTIARAALDGGLTVEQINEIVRDVGGAVNCYPGVPGDTCYDKAVFVSLEGRTKRKSRRGHLTQEQMFVEFNRHFTMCPKTRVAVIICDTWSAPTYDHWRLIIKTIAERGVHIEFYLVGPGWKVALPSLP